MTTPNNPAEPHAGDPGANDHPEFARALIDLYAPSARVPASIDAEILSKARWRLARPITRVLPWALPLSAAAAIALAVWWPQAAQQEPRKPARHAPALAMSREDFDRSGRVDILDAYSLACKVDRGEPVASTWDLNRDGAVDRKDVDTIAMAAVRVK